MLGRDCFKAYGWRGAWLAHATPVIHQFFKSAPEGTSESEPLLSGRRKGLKHCQPSQDFLAHWSLDSA